MIYKHLKTSAIFTLLTNHTITIFSDHLSNAEENGFSAEENSGPPDKRSHPAHDIIGVGVHLHPNPRPQPVHNAHFRPTAGPVIYEELRASQDQEDHTRRKHHSSMIIVLWKC